MQLVTTTQAFLIERVKWCEITISFHIISTYSQSKWSQLKTKNPLIINN